MHGSNALGMSVKQISKGGDLGGAALH